MKILKEDIDTLFKNNKNSVPKVTKFENGG